MAELPVPVVVDAATGAWSVDGSPMILVPRHFFVGIQKAVEARLGVAATDAMLREVTEQAARDWCAKEAGIHGLAGIEVLRHYLKRMSQRGYGRFTLEAAEPKAGTARVRLDHSVYVAEYGAAGRRVCYMFTGALIGGISFATRAAGGPEHLHAEEVSCGAEGAPHCSFVVRPA
ncbi:MAG: hypothetical protein EXQ96_06570 [Alphaproteobacteria bacterium]|nr:hypothetical protein [Alphaproteobacteria bacterium]